MQDETRPAVPLNAKIAAIYLIGSAVVGIAFLYFRAGPYDPQFAAKSLAFKIGAYGREYAFNVLFLISGIGVLGGRSWARKLAVAVLVITAIYSAFAFARGFELGFVKTSHGRPVPPFILPISLAIMGVWNGLWIYLICRKAKRRMKDEG